MRYKDKARSNSPPAGGVLVPSSTDLTSTGSSRIRRASYYVWFLGAEECRGLRGPEVVRPILSYLLEREREHEPEKVTLQVSGRGIKLLQQGVTSRAAAAGSTKHFIPCGALTHVQQEESPDDDIVSAVLLIYNPLTRCPVHVHSYRCDSTETAAVLKQHLQQLLEKPEQQAKLAALEARLASRGLLPSSGNIRGGGAASDGASSGGSVSSGAGSGSGRVVSGDKMATLYDSLAAELREKLGTRNTGPLLFPPRDYDRTGRRKKIHGGEISSRKNLEDDSARSSGIGSDDAPSPTQDHLHKEFGGMDHPSSSDEEWANHESAELKGETSLVLVQPTWRGQQSNSPRHNSHIQERKSRIHQQSSNFSPIKVTRRPSRRNKDRSISPVSPHDRFQDARDKFLSLERQRSAVEISAQSPHTDGINRSTSWEVSNHSKNHQMRNQSGGELRKGIRRSKRDSFGSKEDILWPKSDRDTGYGSRDALKERRQKDITKERELDPWRKEVGRKTPEVWEHKGVERSISPHRGRVKTPVKDVHRMARIRSPERHHEYQRAKSMHDLSQRRYLAEDDRRVVGSRDPRRHSLYDPAEDSSFLDSRRPAFSSHTHLARPNSSCSSNSSSPMNRYNELPDNQRFPGLDRATARQEPLDQAARLAAMSKRMFDYPVNGGHAPIHITRAHHDDYRRFRYDHGNGQFMRTPLIPPTPY